MIQVRAILSGKSHDRAENEPYGLFVLFRNLLKASESPTVKEGVSE